MAQAGKWRISGRGFTTVVEVFEGKIVNCPEHIEQYQWKNWDWAQEQFKRFQWGVEPEIDFDVGDAAE